MKRDQPFDPLRLYAQLAEDFPRHCEVAGSLRLPAEQDGDGVRMTLVGFVHFCGATRPGAGGWTADDARTAREYRAAMPSPPFSHAWVDFSCLAMGSVLGLRRAGVLTDLQALHADSLLPGFMIRNRGKLEGLYMVGQIKRVG